MEDILTIILKDTYSLTQLRHRLRILKSNLLNTFFGGNPASASEIMPPQDLEWLKSLPPAFYQKFNKNNVYQVFTDLEGQITRLQTLVMYLPFEPDYPTLNQIGAFARKTFSPNLLLDIKLDPNLIAGTAFSWKGMLRDYSLRAQLAERKQEILQEFKKFLR